MVSDSTGPPVALRCSAMAAMAATCSATLAPWFLMPNVSDAQTTMFASSQPDATARSQPRWFSTRPMRERPGVFGRAAITSSAPAICGTRRGLTKDTASSRVTPAASSRRMNSSFRSTSRVTASFCSPSRGPTSTISMRRLMARLLYWVRWAPVKAAGHSNDRW